MASVLKAEIRTTSSPKQGFEKPPTNFDLSNRTSQVRCEDQTSGHAFDALRPFLQFAKTYQIHELNLAPPAFSLAEPVVRNQPKFHQSP